jgi:hypothetical protein
MSARQVLTSIAYGLLKIGAIVFLFPIFWENIQNPNITGDIAVNRLLLWGVIYLVVTFIILVISRENFNMFGFMIILFASGYKIIDILISKGLHTDTALYFFVLCICFYFMTKEFRTRRRMVTGGF